MLALDLGVLNRRSHRVGFREALAWSGVWIALAAAFAVLVLFWQGGLGAPVRNRLCNRTLAQHRQPVRISGRLPLFQSARPVSAQGAVLGNSRGAAYAGAFILAGVGLIRRFSWITYAFGALLVYSGLKLLRQGETKIHPEKNPFCASSGEFSRSRKNMSTDSFLRGDLRAGTILAYQRALRDSVAGRAPGHRDHRHSFCGGFRSGRSRHHLEPLHCVYLKRVRHSRPALDVLRPGRNDRPLSLPSLRIVGRAGSYRPQNARVALRDRPHRMGAGGCAVSFGSIHCRIASESARKRAT